jgi:glutathione S-transferase
MVKLYTNDIKTREVLEWRGVHLLNFSGSSCSQKTRIFLNLKGIDWTSHPVDLIKEENFKPWFLGINPRGLVPVLVHDGEVHIESNDILAYLEEQFPTPALIPEGLQKDILNALRDEDDLHLDIRNITMRYVIPSFMAAKKPASLDSLAGDSGTVEGEPDPHKKIEFDYWNNFARQGITDEQIQISADKFRRVYEEFDARLKDAPYLMGQDITLLDIAWFIYTYRLKLAGYPFSRLHQNVARWFSGLLKQPEFSREVAMPLPLKIVTPVLHAAKAARGTSFETIAQL